MLARVASGDQPPDLGNRTLHPWRVWKAQVDAVDSYDHVAQGAAGEATKDAHSLLVNEQPTNGRYVGRCNRII